MAYQVKELAQEALTNSLFEPIQPSLVVDTNTSRVEIPLVFAEKFAELIVQECITVASQQPNPSNLNYKPSERLVEALKFHFGV